MLAVAHAYQIGAARDEIPPHLHGTAALLARAPDLLVLSSSGAGYDTIDVEACTEAGVLAVNQAGGNREAVAEHVLGMMLLLSKRIIQADRHMRREAGISRNAYVGNNIHGKTLGIIGLGNTGSPLAELCRGLFAMPVLACDPYLDRGPDRRPRRREGRARPVAAPRRLRFGQLPAHRRDAGHDRRARVRLMKPTAWFINTARGGIHDEAALEAAMANGTIAGAGLDVWAVEPPPPDHPLLRFDNVIASPHTAGVTVESRETIARIAAEQLLEILDGRRPPRLLNPEVWPAYAKRSPASSASTRARTKRTFSPSGGEGRVRGRRAPRRRQ